MSGRPFPPRVNRGLCSTSRNDGQIGPAMHPLFDSSSDDEELFLLMDSSDSSDEDSEPIPRRPRRNGPFTGEQYTNFLLNGNPRTMHDILRVDAQCFRALVLELVCRGQLNWAHMRLSVEESLAIFLYICGQSGRHRTVADRFQHSTDTISRHFNYMRRALCTIAPFIICPPDLHITPPQILNDNRYYPWFKDCVGAIDGTHIEAWTPNSRETAYRGRKTKKTQNVMAVCSFDRKFIFVYSGWEGSAHDSRVFAAVVTNPVNNFPHPPNGKFYLVDARYANMPGYLAPYRKERYHGRNFNAQGYVYHSSRELFNHRHSSLRSVIERCFGVLKKRFALLKTMPNYKPARQPSIVTACCVIHNWIITQVGRDAFFDDEDEDEDEDDEDDDDDGNEVALGNELVVDGNAPIGVDQNQVNMSPENMQQMAMRRDEIATAMWNAHVNN